MPSLRKVVRLWSQGEGVVGREDGESSFAYVLVPDEA